MQITVYGAANDVTGSCYLLQDDRFSFLIDCGMFQGSEKLERLNYIPKGINVRKLDAVVLTHGHLDHCGRLPLLTRAGYHGPIYCTEPTAQIAKLVMTDSAKIQEEDTERENRQRHQQRLPKLEPIYDVEDVEKVCKLFQTRSYGEPIEIGGYVTCTLVDAGHILGSASVEVQIAADDQKKLLVFSGDVGRWDVPILRDPETIPNADLVFMESTYGSRNHRSLPDTVTEFKEAIAEAIKRKGKVLIPTFAVGRAQLILFYLAQMIRNKDVEPLPIYLDSPMAISATEIYDKYVAFMDPESQQLHNSGELKHDLQTLQLCTTVEQSKSLNDVEGPCVIMAGAGMCNAGRILHHLRHNLGSPETIVLIVGYQPKGSLGRALVDGAPTVKISGETVHVRATIKGLGGFSAHAGQDDLLKWLAPMAATKPRIVLVHGEPNSMDELAFNIQERFDISAEKPKLGDTLMV